MKKNNILLFLAWLVPTLLVAYSCDRKSEGSRKASLLITNTVEADGETDAVKRSKRDDAADDPAIWIHPDSPEKSCIIGTDKKGGLAVYDLSGKELFYYADGMMNNVDVRQNIRLKDTMTDIVACSNRTSNTIDLYEIERNGNLQPAGSKIKVKMKDEVYGFCLAQNKEQSKLYAFVNSVSGKVEQWAIDVNNDFKGSLVRSFQLQGKTEGMVADDENGILFIGEEAKGIWKTQINPDFSKEPELLKQSTIEGNQNIYEDIEGLCIYFQPNGEGYLLASSQGNYSYAVFERKAPHNYIGSFRITDGIFDGAEETDGLDVTNLNLGEKYPNGLLVVQDGYNKENGKSIAQNFKLVKWEKIASLLQLKKMDNNYSYSFTNLQEQAGKPSLD